MAIWEGREKEDRLERDGEHVAWETMFRNGLEQNAVENKVCRYSAGRASSALFYDRYVCYSW